MQIYQVLPRLFKSGRFSAFDAPTLEWIKGLGFSHIWYTGIPRHSFGKDYVKGDLGSPYSIIDYYDVNPYLADSEDERIEEFKQLVSRTHAAGMKVLIDFVPNHVSPDYSDSHGGIRTLGCCDYDWTDTEKIDYGQRANWDALAAILDYWCSLGVDGFRCDMVELVPVDFFHFLTGRIRQSWPDTIFIGEVYNTESYSRYISWGGFDYLYDKSGLYDTLRGIVSGQRMCWDITGNWQRLGGLQPNMLNFLENHDEQRLASPWFGGCPQKGYAALAVSALFYPCPFMVYFGQEIGESAFDGHEGRTSIFSQARHIDPTSELTDSQKEVLDRYREVLRLHEEFSDASNFDLCYFQKGANGFDMRRHFAFMRSGSAGTLLVVCNFSSSPAHIKIEVPCVAPQGFADGVEADIAPWDFAIWRK